MTQPTIFTYPLLIKEYHLDTFGHVNNATYLQILEEARWDFLTAKGMDLETIKRTGIGPVVLECRIQFLKELGLRQEVIIESQVLSFEKKIGLMRQDIFDKSGEHYNHAEFTFGFLNLNIRKLIVPSAELISALQGL